MRGSCVAVALALTAAVACTPTTYVVDQFAVPVDLDAGIPTLLARSPGIQSEALQRVVIDTASPLTVIDDGAGGTSRRLIEIDLLRNPIVAGGSPIERAQFLLVPAVLTAVGAIGEGAPFPMGGVIGSDILSRVAVRLDPRGGALSFSSDLAGNDTEHENQCDAVFEISLVGGGKFAIGDDDVLFTATRVVLGACLAPDAPSCLDSNFPCKTGQDAVLLVSTGIAPTILTRSAYKRTTGVDDAAIDALPKTMLYLDGVTSGAGEAVPLGSIDGLSLVAHERDQGPCAELANGRIMAHGGCDTTTRATCHCDDTDAITCSTGAAIELTQPIEVVILEDTHPLLQNLRNELRPDVADIDGLLGWKALGPLVTDLDYPHSRVVIRCSTPDGSCQQRPRIGDPVTDRRLELINTYHCLP